MRLLVPECTPCPDVCFTFFLSRLQLPDDRSEKADIRTGFQSDGYNPKTEEQGGSKCLLEIVIMKLRWAERGMKEGGREGGRESGLEVFVKSM